MKKNVSLFVLAIALLAMLMTRPVPTALAQQELGPESIPIKWEKLGKGQGMHTYRSRTVGGWLVAIMNEQHSANGIALGGGVTFVPDPKHAWRVD